MKRVSPALALGVILASAMCLSGCIHLFPVGRVGETAEAKKLAKVLKDFAPETADLLQQEHDTANALKITLDESAQVPRDVFRQKFNAYADRFIAIRNRRRQIVDTLRHDVWQSPMVFVVQQKAIQLMNDEITRTETWIRFAQNVRLRADLGRDKDFPEFAMLSHQLEGFLGLVEEDPLSLQIRALMLEYRFGVEELG